MSQPFKTRRMVNHQQMEPGERSAWFEVPLTDLGRPGRGAKKAWVRLPANSRSTGWAEKPGFGKLYYDWAVPLSRCGVADAAQANYEATAYLQQPDTVLIGKQRPLTPDTAVLGHSWLAPDRGYQQRYLEIKAEYEADLLEQAAEMGISLDPGMDIIRLDITRDGDRVQVMVPYATGREYATAERRWWGDDQELQADLPNPDWAEIANRYDRFWMLAKVSWS